MINLLKNWFRRSISRYLFTPIPKIDPFRIAYRRVFLKLCPQIKSSVPLSEDQSELDFVVPPGSHSSFIHGVELGSRLKIKQPLQKVLVLLKGQGNHLFYNNRRFEALFAKMGQSTLAYSCNPRGVFNGFTDMRPGAYLPVSLSLQDVVEDYSRFVRAVMRRHPQAKLVLVGHSAGGMFARLVARRILQSKMLAARLQCVYSSVSFRCFEDFVDTLSLEEMIRDACPYLPLWMQNCMHMADKHTGRCYRRLLRHCIKESGWSAANIPHLAKIPKGMLWQTNLKPQYDHVIGKLSTVLKESTYNRWMLPAAHSPLVDMADAHAYDPSQLCMLSGESEMDFFAKVLHDTEKADILV